MKTYIEAGANDGFFQSRSLDLSTNLEYQGILIEPSLVEYEKCVKLRGNDRTHIYNKCLVPFSHKEKTIKLNHSACSPAMNSVVPHGHLEYSRTQEVEATTLQSILDELNVQHVDAFFLDVEGYEYQVLQGIDFSCTTFSMIEIELHAHLLKIKRSEEIEMHEQFLSQFGYQMTAKNNEVQPKIVFNLK